MDSQPEQTTPTPEAAPAKEPELRTELQRFPTDDIYSSARGLAVKILTRVERTDAYLDKLLDYELRTSDPNDPDRRLLAEITHGVLRWQSKLDWVLTGFYHGEFPKCIPQVKNAMRVALYQIMFLSRVPHHAAVNDAVEFVKRLKGTRPADMVNAVLRSIIRSIDGIRYPERSADLARFFSITLSHPLWMVRRWLARFGEEDTERLLLANNTKPLTTLRINRQRVEIDRFIALLDGGGVQYTRSSLVPNSVKVEALPTLTDFELFKQGTFSVQDESAQLAAVLLDPQPGERVIDLCAAPGGKSAHIAEIMGNVGEVIAVDKYDKKLHLVESNALRLGLTIVSTAEGDGRTIELPLADRVLVDAPCSGLGTIAKKPDIKWKREPEDLVALVKTQDALLDNAARLLKPGGILVYSTCSMEPEEDAERVEAFLARHPEFSKENATPFVSPNVISADGFVETFPHRNGCDGAFAARLRKA
jgi:16S rRNA (cytosine967-C5)-methyltransferase